MAKKRVFSTAAISAMRDTELTGQDLRIYLWVSLHDGMSLLKGSGPGCFASNKTLFQEAGCDYASGCRSLSKLVKNGHLVREKVGKSTRYRVTFPDPDDLQPCNPSNREIGDHPASDESAICCNENSETRRNQPKTERDYSPLSGGLYLGKPKEKYSDESAHFAVREKRVDALLADEDELPPLGKNGAEALATNGCSILSRLSRSFSKLTPDAQLARFEEAFASLGRNAEGMESRERQIWSDWLWGLSDDFQDEPVGRRALRLYDEVAAL